MGDNHVESVISTTLWRVVGSGTIHWNCICKLTAIYNIETHSDLHTVLGTKPLLHTRKASVHKLQASK